MYSIVRLLPESIPWLAANGKVEKAEAILHRAAKCNKVEFPEETILKREENENNVEDKVELNGQTQGQGDGVTDGLVDKQGECHHEVNTVKEPTLKSSLLSFLTNVKGKKVKVKTLVPEADKVTCLDIGKSRKMVLYASIMCSLW